MSHAAEPAFDAAQVQVPATHPLARLQQVGLAVGLVGMVAFGFLAASNLDPALHSYLVAFEFWLSIALGGLFFVLVQHVARAGWSIAVRRLAENAMATLPLFAVLFLPILAAVLSHRVYEWTHHDVVAADPILSRKEPYLNVGFFVVRALIYFAAWTLIARWYRGLSVRQDATGDVESSYRMRKWAGPALVVFAFTVTFSAFDWIMSLYPHWYSTIFGGYFFAGCVIAQFAFMIVTIEVMRWKGLLGGAVTEEHHFNVGKLLFAFTVFWAYVAFSQFMLIWYANMPEETIFFEKRFHGSWQTLSLVLMIGHFIVPFFYLMPRTVKRCRPLLLLGALWMLLMHYLDLYWLVMPVTSPEGVSFSMTDVAAFLLVGGVFLAFFGRILTSASLVPMKDPRLAESLRFWDP